MKLTVALLIAHSVTCFGGIFGLTAAPASACDGSIESTECEPPPNITWRGKGEKPLKLKPAACLNDQAWDMMNGPGIEFWFTYYQRWRNGARADMPPIIRTRCITEQFVDAGVRLGFWVDCDGYRWWYETDPITSSGQYVMKLVQKKKLS